MDWDISVFWKVPSYKSLMSPLPSEPNLLPAEKRWQLTVLLRKGGLSLLLLFTTGWILSPVEDKVWEEIKENVSPAELKATHSQTGQGLMMATLGGFRSIVADIQWLSTMVAWEREDKDKTIAQIQFTVTIDPRPTFFWLNGARMMAYDMRHWNKAQHQTPESFKMQSDELAKSAIQFLELAQQYHPDNPLFIIEIGHIYLNRLEDFGAAAHYYLKAYTQYEDTPYYVGRLHAQLLQKMGKHQEAYDFLTSIYADLPSEDFYSHKPIVLERIRRLERKLKIPAPEQFQPQ
jgi:tetratricopeptide (TPR) repeat protein